MDKSTISEEFGKHLASVTEGTIYDVSPDTDDESFISEMEHRIRRVMYSMWMDAQANRLANDLERKMNDYFQDLYEFSYGVTLYDTMEHSAPRKTDTLALMIIDEKEAYKKRIKCARVQHSRFKKICSQLFQYDRELFIRYFERSEKVEYELLRESIKHNLLIIEVAYGYEQKKHRQVKKKYAIPGVGNVSEVEMELCFRETMKQLFDE